MAPGHSTRPSAGSNGRPHHGKTTGKRHGHHKQAKRIRNEPRDAPDHRHLDLATLAQDPLVLLATGHWGFTVGEATSATLSAPGSKRPVAKPMLWDPRVVESIYCDHLDAKGFPAKTLALLETSLYLEKYLWPHLDKIQRLAPAHILSIVLLVNEKFRQRVNDPWQFLAPADGKGVMASTPDAGKSDRQRTQLAIFFQQLVMLLSPPHFQAHKVAIKRALVTFLVHCFQSLEHDLIRPECMRLVSVASWHCLCAVQVRDCEFQRAPKLHKFWNHLERKFAQANPDQQAQLAREQTLIANLFGDFLALISQVPAMASEDSSHDQVGNGASDTLAALTYGETCLELFIELVAQLPTRRCFHALLQDHQIVVACRQSPWYVQPSHRVSKRFAILTDMLDFYADFEIDSSTGAALLETERTNRHYEQVESLQLYAFQHLRSELHDFVMASIADVDNPRALQKYFGALTGEQLVTLCQALGIRTVPRPPSTNRTGSAPTVPPEPNADSGAMAVDTTDTLGTATACPALYNTQFLLAVLAHRFSRRPSQIDLINALPLYPNEGLIFDEALNPTQRLSANRSIGLADLAYRLSSPSITAPTPRAAVAFHCLPLPQLNLQFLTLKDYLLRNFLLFELESTYGIRQDLEDAIQRLRPRLVHDDVGNRQGTQGQHTQFHGWSRMGCLIEAFSVVQVTKPRLGSNVPGQVRADVTINVSRYTDSIRQEWDNQIRPRDVLFLVTVAAKPWTHRRFQDEGKDRRGYGKGRKPLSFQDHFGVQYVRGCEVSAVLDDEGKPVDERGKPKDEQQRPQGPTRTYRVLLDTNQYAQDMAQFSDRPPNRGATNDASAVSSDHEDVYETFNVLIRRKPEENNFKAVLETMRDLMQSHTTIPAWLQSVFLGYGDPGSAHYTQLPNALSEIDFRDTFVDFAHLQECFPQEKVLPASGWDETMPAPYVVQFPAKSATEAQALMVRSYRQRNMGPYPFDVPKRNTVRFTPRQVEAIRSGCNPGLTLIVGPPGTGKTDVAVQIIANLYHTFPDQHILLVTHSNQALNQLFAKIMALDIDERHLLRLGHGEEELESAENFSKFGRVNSFLARRLTLLQDVDRLAQSLQVPGAHGDTCETASYFYISHVLPRWEPYLQRLEACQEPATQATASDQRHDNDEAGTLAKQALVDHFPFYKYFANAPQPLFAPNLALADMVEVAVGCFRHIHRIFTELEELRAFELLRTNHDRSNYLLTKEAKIVAMTCTHAALKRRELVAMGFKYDTMVMEEAAQVLEVETFIPLLLQTPAAGEADRLKRIVLIGDHHQLPPVVQNHRFQQYSNLEQSMFTRFIRLGVPHIQLDRQGRARPSIAALYAWRYRALGNLPNVQTLPQYQLANPGFAHAFQAINVNDYQGKGETQPVPYYYQNLGEAEYVVAMYQYMRLLGYPADRITILTTYNGQRALIRDVLQERCRWNPEFFQMPSKVTTVDKYQGQQNDYVLLSLVRTRAVGHLRDVRRLVVAVSRARLGLYVFCRRSLFETCAVLAPTFQQFAQPPEQLALVPNEVFDEAFERTEQATQPVASELVQDVAQMGDIVYQRCQAQFKRSSPALAVVSPLSDAGESAAESNDEPAAVDTGSDGSDVASETESLDGQSD
ncbi:hypothetical protein H4R34_000073 [Dimargaris verticillata]|uniref:Pre-mRNA-splicing factor n=1 Tax=Dimargaris verticillata TaxID=2761393 RepID=A0A9W8B7I0_9FUNG|nr:hypothetical protein H4R34_000073 [Dimargaris verticillata]